jgi:CDP-glucose 4,6-dehydratase
MTFWQDKRVLVTGATGLLGSALVKDLLKNKADVICLLRDWVPESEMFRNENVNDVTIVSGAITNQPLLERVLGEYEIETVFHLAAQTIVKVANNNPVSTFESNIKGTWTVLEACRRSPAVTSIVVASSDKAYGTQPTLPYNEDMPLQGMYPYDVSKVCTDMIAQSYAQTYQLPIGITRCGNFYGPGDLNWNRIIPGTIRSVLRNQRPVIRSDGTTIRDYLFIEDAVKGYLRLAEFLDGWKTVYSGEAFNLSTETPITTFELVNTILSIMDSDLEPVVLNRATNEIKEQWLSADKAHRLLNWYPLYHLDDGLRTTINWYKEILK